MLAALLLAGIIAAPLGSIALLLPGRHRDRPPGNWSATRRFVLAVVAWLADRGVRWLRRPTVQRWLERITGIVLIGFGLRLATESRRFA